MRAPPEENPPGATGGLGILFHDRNDLLNKATIASAQAIVLGFDIGTGGAGALVIDMTRDNRDRLEIFAREPIEVRRLALSLDQVQRYRLPPNPAKETDSRFAAYAEQFGEASWELDDLDPTVIVELIRAELENLIDVETWNEALSKETANPATLGEASKNWAEVEKYLRREARNV